MTEIGTSLPEAGGEPIELDLDQASKDLAAAQLAFSYACLSYRDNPSPAVRECLYQASHNLVDTFSVSLQAFYYSAPGPNEAIRRVRNLTVNEGNHRAHTFNVLGVPAAKIMDDPEQIDELGVEYTRLRMNSSDDQEFLMQVHTVFAGHLSDSVYVFMTGVTAYLPRV